ncbi:unnamed protein product [Paramecium sonneborni]|uniref:NACHT domain-containing protein n=1 Tax=Paramecium sonneborni TaxID=65129 RepID=A0A8S1RRB3_9CILI|nr:unnamed protein product [Paramecium sonneborni]
MERKAKSCKNITKIQRLIQEFERVFINKDNPSHKLISHQQKQWLRGGGCGCGKVEDSQPSNPPIMDIHFDFSSNIQKYSIIIAEQASLIFDKMKKNDVLIAFLWFQDNGNYIQSLCLNDQLTLIHYPLIEKTLENLIKCLHIYLRSQGYLFYQLLQICNCLIRVIFTYQLKKEDRFLQESLKEVFLEQINNVETLMQIESTNIWITGVEFEIQLIKTWLSHCRTNSQKSKQLGLAVLTEIALSIVQLKPSDQLIDSLYECGKFILMNFFECQIKNPIQKYEIYYFFESLKWSILNQFSKKSNCSVQKQIKQIQEGYKKYIAPSKDWMIHFCWINLISDLISYRPIINKKDIVNIIQLKQTDHEIFQELINSQHIVSILYDKTYARVQIFNVEQSTYQIFEELKLFQEYLISKEAHELKLWHQYINFEINNNQNSSISDDDLKLQLLRSQTNCDEIFKLNKLLENLRNEILKLINEIIEKKIISLNTKNEQQIQLNIQKQDLKYELKQLKQKTLQSIYICNEIDIKLNQEKVKIITFMQILKFNEEQYNSFVKSFEKINKFFQNDQVINIWFQLFKFIYQNYEVLKQKDLIEFNKENTYDQAKFKATVTDIINEVNILINLIKQLQLNFTSILCQKTYQLVIEKTILSEILKEKLKEIQQQTFFKEMIVQSKLYIQQNFSIEKWELQSINCQQYLIECRSLTLIIFTFYRLLQVNNMKKKLVQEKLTKLLTYCQTQQQDNHQNSQNKKNFKDQILKKIKSQKTKLEQIKNKYYSTEANEGEIQEYTNVIQSILQDIEWISKSDFDQQFKNSFITIFKDTQRKNEFLNQAFEIYKNNLENLTKKYADQIIQNSQNKTNKVYQFTNTQEPENLIKSLSNILQMTKKIRFILKTNQNIHQVMQNDQKKEQTSYNNSQKNSPKEEILTNLQEQIQITQLKLEVNISNSLDQEAEKKLNQFQQCDLYQSYLILFNQNINQLNQMNNQFEEITLDENLSFMFQQQNYETIKQQNLGILSIFDNHSYKVREALAFNLIRTQNIVQEGTIQEICSNLLKQIWIIEKNPSVRKVLQNKDMIEMQKQLFSKDLSLFSNQLKKEMTNKLNQIEELENQIFKNDNSKELQIQFQQAYDEFEIFLDNLSDMSQKLEISMIFLKDISKNLQTIKYQLDQLIKNVSDIGNDVRRLREKNKYQNKKKKKNQIKYMLNRGLRNLIQKLDKKLMKYHFCQKMIKIIMMVKQMNFYGMKKKGKAGSGKSRAAINVEEFLWKFNTQQLNQWYPIYISLPSLNDPQHNLIDQALESETYNFDKIQIREFKEAIQNDNLKIVLILDSYDEMKNEFIQTNLITTNRLSQDLNLKESGQKLKVIITCREEILTSSTYQSWFYGKSIDTFKEVQLVPFNQEQSSLYIKLSMKLSIIRELSQFYDMIKQLKGSGFIFSEFRKICLQLDSLIEEIIYASQQQDILVQDQDGKKIVKKLQQIPEYQFVKDQQFLFLQKGLLSLWSEQKFTQTIQNLKIDDFLKTPFMLEIIVQILPKVSYNYLQSSTIRELLSNNYKKLKYQILYQKQVQYNYQQKNQIKLETDFKDIIEKQLSQIMNELENQLFFDKYQISSKLDFQDSSIIQSQEEYILKFDDAEIIYQSLKMNQFTTYDFYEMFVNYYHYQQIQKWMELGKISNSQMISIDLLEFSQSLALDMIRHEQFQVNYQPRGRLLFSSINQQNQSKQLQWEDQYFSELDTDSDYKQLVRKCILLSSKGSQHSFTHKSIQEFFVAKHIFNLLENTQNNNESDKYQLQNSLMNNNSFNISHEHFQGALILLKGKLQNKDNITKRLVSLVQLSKKDSKFIRLASNIIFFLGFLGKNLGKQDFDSIFLSDTNINGLNFCESVLSNAFFNKVSIDQCNFNNAIITDAEWNNIITKERITKDYQNEIIADLVLSENGNEFYTLSLFDQHQIILRQFNQFKLDQKPIEMKFNLKFKDDVLQIQTAKYISIICCETKNSIQLWNLQDQNNNINNDDCIILRNLGYKKVILSQDGSQLIISMDNIIIWLKELLNLKINNTLTTTESIPDLEGNWKDVKMAISLNAKLLAIVNVNKIILWDIQDYQNIIKVQEIQHKEDDYNSIAFSRNGNYLVFTKSSSHAIMEINNQRKFNIICSFLSINKNETALISSDNNYIAFYGRKYLAIYQTSNIKQFQQNFRIPHKLEDSKKVVATISNNFELFACTSSSTIHIWNLKELNQIQYLGVLESAEQNIQVLEFSHDCQNLISFAYEYIMQIWDVKQMKLIKKFTSKFRITNLIFSSDGQVLVSYNYFYGILLWDMSNIQEPVIFQEIDSSLSTKFLIVSKKQGHLIINKDSKFVIWDIQCGKEIQEFEKDSIAAIFNDDGNKFATYHGGIVEIWKLQENIFEIEHTIKCHHKLIFCSNNDDIQLLKNSQYYKFFLKEILAKDYQFYWNVQVENEGYQLFLTLQKEFIEIYRIYGQSYYYIQECPIVKAVFSANSSILCLATKNQQIITMDISKTKIIHQFNIDTSEIFCLQLSEVDDILAIAHENKDQIQIDLYTIMDRENPRKLKSTECFGVPHTMLFMNNNQYLIIGIGSVIERFDLDNFKQSQLVGFTSKNQEFIQYLDGQHIIFVNLQGQICFLTTNSISISYEANILNDAKKYFFFFKKNTYIIQIFSQKCHNLFFNEINANTNQYKLNVKAQVDFIRPTNKQDLWIFKAKGQLIIFDLKKNAIINIIEDEDYKSSSDLQLSEDDQYLVSAYRDSHIKVWDMKTYKLLFKQKMNTDSLYRVLISTKGMLVSCYKSKLKIWNFKALRQQQNLEMDGHIDSINKMLVSPDGLVLYSASNGEIKFWDLEELQLLNEYYGDYKFLDCKFDNTGTYFYLQDELQNNFFYFTSNSEQIIEIFNTRIIFWNLKQAEKWYKLSTQFSNQQSIKFTISDNCKYVIDNNQFQIFEVDSEMKLKEIKSKDFFESNVLKFSLSHRLNLITISFGGKEIFIYSLSKMEIIQKIVCKYGIQLFCFSLNDELFIVLCQEEYLVFQVVNNQFIKKKNELTNQKRIVHIFPFQEDQFIFIAFLFSCMIIQVFQNLELSQQLEIKDVQSIDAFCTKDKLLAFASNKEEQILIFKLKSQTEIEKIATLYDVRVFQIGMHYNYNTIIQNSAIQFSQNCQFLISLAYDWIIKLWDITNPKSIQLRFLINNYSVKAFQIVQDQECQIALIGNNYLIHKEDYNSNLLLATYQELPLVDGKKKLIQVSSDGKYQLYETQKQSYNENDNKKKNFTQTIFIYDQERKLIKNKTIIDTDFIDNIKFLDSQTLVWNEKNKLIFWKFLIDEDKEFQEFKFEEKILYLTCSPNQQLFLSLVGDRKQLGMYNSQNGEQILKLQTFQCQVTECCFSPCGEKFNLGFLDGSIQLYKFNSNIINNRQPPICYKVFAKSYSFLANNCQINRSKFTSTENENLESLFLEKGAINK